MCMSTHTHNVESHISVHLAVFKVIFKLKEAKEKAVTYSLSLNFRFIIKQQWDREVNCTDSLEFMLLQSQCYYLVLTSA